MLVKARVYDITIRRPLGREIGTGPAELANCVYDVKYCQRMKISLIKNELCSKSLMISEVPYAKALVARLPLYHFISLSSYSGCGTVWLDDSYSIIDPASFYAAYTSATCRGFDVPRGRKCC